MGICKWRLTAREHTSIYYREKIFHVFRQILDVSEDGIALQSISLYTNEHLKDFETIAIDNLSTYFRVQASHPFQSSEPVDLAERGHPWWRSNIVPEYKLDD
ncbi:hypothetical protein PFISCL1PPCAC_25679 [Pristionchus fissidentatus]|uniref:Uncharacterized protein n=1 Tax=Pristionchus fissidentatus TaxID=1538716 RepID=A0AAV5WTI3_9BILA|nr:hypothetical protein PFISCL1PPCAC_25679 [Pristionchus fissidentatus]